MAKNNLSEEELERKFKKRLWWTIAIGFVIISLLWFWNYKSGFDGTFGDKFGVVNSLFSGLAFAGIIITIYMQKHELELQRCELKATRKVFRKQSKIMTDQQNDNTFFNLLSNHRQLVESFKNGTLKLGGGKRFDEQLQNSYTEAISGYEVLAKVSHKWKEYFRIYTESYNTKRILDLNLHDYADYKKLVDSDPITHIFYRELLHIHKFIDTRFQGENVRFYKDTLFKSLTQDEIFIFDTIYYNYPSEREGVIYNPDFYLRHFYVDFTTCELPNVHAIKTGTNKDWLRFTIEHDSFWSEAKIIIFQLDYDGNYNIKDVVEIEIGEFASRHSMEISFLNCIYDSNLGIKNYPFSNKEAISRIRFVFNGKFVKRDNKFDVAFELSYRTNDRRGENDEVYYEITDFQIVALKPDYYLKIVDAAKLFQQK